MIVGGSRLDGWVLLCRQEGTRAVIVLDLTDEQSP
jgi:hypothetical protein